MIEIKERNIPEIFYNNARKLSTTPYLGWKENGVWKTMSWQDTERRVRNVAKGLIHLGVEAKSRVAIFSPNRPEWAISDFAILSTGAADAPIYPTNSATEAEYILNDSNSVICIVAQQEHLDSVVSVWDRVPALKYVVCMDHLDPKGDSRIMQFGELESLGEKSGLDAEVEKRLAGIDLEDMATLIYTSGTTGPPKGVILTHHNFLANVYQAFISQGEVFGEGKCSLSFLPLSHSMERLGGFYLVTYLGGTIYYAESMNKVVDNMREIHPHYLVSVPRLYEKIYAAILSNVEKASPLKKKLFGWARSIGSRATEYRTQDQPMPLGLKLQFTVADRLVLSKIKNGLGADRIVGMISGGGPLSVEINKFCHSIGLVVHEAYGLTETSPLLCGNTFKDFRFGTVGKPVPDTEIRIAEDGEILARGPQIMKGYFNKPEDTAEVLGADGWFKTGDIGILEDGFLRITDRKKDILITAGGKNISPANLESAMIVDRYIENIVVIGDGKRFVSALVVPDFEALESWAKNQGIGYSRREDLIANEQVRALYDQHINEYNQQFARVEQVKKFTLLPNPFSQQTGELTPTNKLRRKIVNQKYEDKIRTMYGD
jgi:long-chain acyl-CoA synthetase